MIVQLPDFLFLFFIHIIRNMCFATWRRLSRCASDEARHDQHAVSLHLHSEGNIPSAVRVTWWHEHLIKGSDDVLQ